jgi:hypothetical protein
MKSEFKLSEASVSRATNDSGYTPGEVVEALKDGVIIKYGDLSLMVTPAALDKARAEWRHMRQSYPDFADSLFAAIEPTLAKRCRRVLKAKRRPSAEFMNALSEDLKLWHVVTQ